MVIFSLNQESIRLLSSFFCIILPQVERNTDVYILLIKVFLVIEKRMHSDIHVFLKLLIVIYMLCMKPFFYNILSCLILTLGVCILPLAIREMIQRE